MDEAVKQIRTAVTIRRQIEAELVDGRVKEFRGKLKKLVEERLSIEKLTASKDSEIAALYEEYADAIPAE